VERCNLTGNFRVVPTPQAKASNAKLHPRRSDQMEVRRHALKLRFWPLRHAADENGKVLDLDYSWIKALKGLDIGELRIHDTIGGNNNLRLIFFVGDMRVKDPLPMIWILEVMQKKRDEFTANQLKIFKAKRIIVIERYYNYRI